MPAPVTRSKPPLTMKYLCSDRDRHGSVRYYVRLPGKPKKRLRAVPGTVEFHIAYLDALKDQREEIENRIKLGPGTFGHMVHLYLGSPDFKNGLNRKTTQPSRRRLLLQLVEQIGGSPADVIGEYDFRDGLARRTHGARKNFHVTLRGLYRWAKERNFVPVDPTTGVALKKKKTQGYYTWTDEDCAAYEQKWPLGTKARLAYELARHTGGRVSNIKRLGKSNERRTEIVFVVKKDEDNTFVQVTVPITPRLREALDAGPLGEKTYLETAYGKEFTDKGISNAFRKWCDAALLPQCSAHGIRKYLATTLGEAGAGDLEIMAVLGHSTPQQAGVYTRAANRKKLAANALQRLVGEQNVPPSAGGGTIKSAND